MTGKMRKMIATDRGRDWPVLLLQALVCALATIFFGCGMPDPNAKIQIVNGDPVNHEQYPWQVSIGSTARGAGAFERHFCGGSLIGALWVLTAAHCVEDNKKKYPISTWVVLHGATKLSKPGRAAVTRAVADVHIHPCYRGDPHKNDGNDIALLRLSEPIVAPTSYAKLPKADESIAPRVDAFVTGYGLTSFSGKGSDCLMKADVAIIAQNECGGYYPDTKISEREVCAAGKGESGTCYTDSGGPLVVEEEKVLVGVVSWGDGRCEGKPGVYARVSHYISWIQETMKRGN